MTTPSRLPPELALQMERLAEILDTHPPEQLVIEAGKMFALSALLAAHAGLTAQQFREILDSTFERNWTSALATLG